jgi:hypothetical protein
MIKSLISHIRMLIPFPLVKLVPIPVKANNNKR